MSRSHPTAVLRLLLLPLLILMAGSALAKDPVGVTTLASDTEELQLRVTVPADEDRWQGLVAVPAGKTASLLSTAASIELGPVATMHGIRLVSLSVGPADDGRREREVSIAFAADPSRSATARPRLAATFARLLESTALGGAAVRGQYEEVPGTYLMIVPETGGALEAVEPLLEWRRRQGYQVQVATTLQTGGSRTEIKAYIQQVYDTATSPLAYISLVGDANGAVPLATWYESLTGYHGEGDHYYTTLEGDDVLADAHIGRLSARSVSELEGIVAKILAYERTPDSFTDPGWYGRATLVGDPSSSGATTIYVNQWLKEQYLQPLGYTQIDTIWTAPFASRIFSSLNQGTSVYAYRGYLGCSGFSTGYIDNLSNGGELPFAVMPTCASGSFASNTHTYTEAMLRNPNGAAIGAVGTATTGTHTRYNNCYFHGTWTGAMGENDRHLGYAHTRGKIELYRQYAANEPNIVEIWSVWNNLMGDPATEMRQALPTVPQVSHAGLLPATAGGLALSVTDALGEPLAGQRVALYQTDRDPVAGYTDPAGQVLLPLPEGAAPGALQVTVTGDDLVPYQGTAQLGAVAAWCSADGWTWDDGGDGMPDPGETGELSVTVRNLGDQAALGVVVGLASQTLGVDVSGQQLVLGDIPAGGTAMAGSWTVTLPADLPDAAPAVLRLDASGAAGAWASLVELPIAAPAFVVTGASWSALPGQTSLLEVTLANEGSAGATGASVSFASTSPFLLPAGPVTVPLGDVAAGLAASASFSLAVSADAWGGHLADCTLTVTTIAGTRQELPLPLALGAPSNDSPVVDSSGAYVAWDDADPSPDAPAYWWRELDPTFGGVGTDLGLTDFAYEQDDTRTVDLPFSFTYHGEAYDQLSICSNGWASFGQTYLVHYRNWGLPAAGAPETMLAVFWDDLVQSGSNRVYHAYFPDEGIYVVQWSRMRNRHNGSQNCELVLYDPAVHETATGDGLIVFQYQQATNNDTSRGYATVGIQNGQDGLTWTYYNRYAPGARTLGTGRAIAFVPTPPAAPAAIAVTPDAFDLQVPPGGSTQVTLEITSDGAMGSILNWQVGVREPQTMTPAAAVVEEPGSRDRWVTLTAPDGGETWLIGEAHQITWDASSELDAVRLQIDRGQGDGWQTLEMMVDAALGAYSWIADGPASQSCRIRVTDLEDVLVFDTSDQVFTITPDLSWISVEPAAGQITGGETATVSVTLDASGLPNGTYELELVILSSGGAPVIVPLSVVVDEISATPDALPSSLDLAQNAPNPFNPRTVIDFALPRDSQVRLTVHDLRGRLVRTLRSATLPAGSHQVVFDGTGDDGRRLASGTYVYRLQAGGEVQTRRLTLVK